MYESSSSPWHFLSRKVPTGAPLLSHLHTGTVLHLITGCCKFAFKCPLSKQTMVGSAVQLQFMQVPVKAIAAS